MSLYKQLTLDPMIFKNLICMIIIWVSASFTSYLLRYQLKYIKGDLYINNLVTLFGDILASGCSGLMLACLSPKQILMLAFILGTFGMLLLTLLKPSNDQTFIISLYVFIGKLGISGGFNTVFIANTTFFPVSIAATTIGICNVFCRTASIFSPFVAEIHPEYIP